MTGTPRFSAACRGPGHRGGRVMDGVSKGGGGGQEGNGAGMGPVRARWSTPTTHAARRVASDKLPSRTTQAAPSSKCSLRSTNSGVMASKQSMSATAATRLPVSFSIALYTAVRMSGEVASARTGVCKAHGCVVAVGCACR
jgi:hypothetical protein